ncbi:hypothetical protein QQ054_00385 [Oscillatoria amoena NRMC-F 0135]|nr:hypothetical protein [Oscillatoria amoena NRMC-F 0135]
MAATESLIVFVILLVTSGYLLFRARKYFTRKGCARTECGCKSRKKLSPPPNSQIKKN